MTIARLIVDREELIVTLGLEQAFINRWCAAAADRDFAAGLTSIPAMPRITGIGKATKFHLESVEAWLLRYFQKGGEPLQAKK